MFPYKSTKHLAILPFFYRLQWQFYDILRHFSTTTVKTVNITNIRIAEIAQTHLPIPGQTFIFIVCTYHMCRKKKYNEYCWNLLVYYVRNEREKQQYLLKYKGYKRVTCWWCDLTYGGKQQQRNVCRLASVTLPKVLILFFVSKKLRNFDCSGTKSLCFYVSFRQFHKRM